MIYRPYQLLDKQIDGGERKMKFDDEYFNQQEYIIDENDGPLRDRDLKFVTADPDFEESDEDFDRWMYEGFVDGQIPECAAE